MIQKIQLFENKIIIIVLYKKISTLYKKIVLFLQIKLRT